TDEIADQLYALPIEEFTQARNDAATELRKAGRRDEAEEVKALRKPTAVAGAVNRLVREHRDQVEEYLTAAAELRDAQVAGKGDVAAATKRERETLDRLLRLASGEVRQTLQAAAVDDEAAEELRRGRLERDLVLVQCDVLGLPRKVVVVRGHIEMAVAREVEEDRPLLARLVGLAGVLQRAVDGVRRLGRGDDALATGEENRGSEHLALDVG